jgi:hypothetical protein
VIDPAVTYDRPDVEALVWQTIKDLKPNGKGLNSFMFTAVPLPSPLGWLVANSIQVDVRDRNKASAYVLAIKARNRILALPSTVWADGVVSSVTILEDAFWNPDPDGTPRYTARYVIDAHPIG